MTENIELENKEKEEKTLFEVEDKIDLISLSHFFKTLSEKILERRFEIQYGDKTVSLTLPSVVELEIEVEEDHSDIKGIKKSLEIELEWLENDLSKKSLKLV